MTSAAIASSTLTHAREGSRPPTYFCHPPAQSDEEEPPVVKELGRLAFKRMAHELEQPADREQAHRNRPEGGREEHDHEQRNRQHDQRDAERVAKPIHRVLMTLRVSADPLVPRSSTEQHRCLPPFQS